MTRLIDGNTAMLADPEKAAWLRLGVVGRRFNPQGDLSGRDREVLAGCLSRAGEHRAGSELAPMDAPTDAPKLILSGWACLSRSLLDGRRQIVELYLPGDLLAYSSRPEIRTKGSYQCLTEVRCAEARDLLHHIESGAASRGFVASLRAMEEEGQARMIERLVSVGRMLSHERMSHFVLDLYRRHLRVGLVMGDSFAMPLTQEMIGDVLGLSTVHVNRTLQLLRREQALKTSNGRWQILDYERMAAYAAGQRGQEDHKSNASW